VTTYEEPTDYIPANAAKFRGEKRPEPGQTGVSGLLEGEQMFIKPEGFDETHDRHGIQHRLKDEKKWQPLGIGSGASNEEMRSVSETAPDGQTSQLSDAKQ
jgi:lysine 2,3-aminomutase